MAQLVLAYMWGIISDRYGRKQLILMSNLFSTVSMLMFGLAGNYTVAAAARILGGACVSCLTLYFSLTKACVLNKRMNGWRIEK